MSCRRKLLGGSRHPFLKVYFLRQGVMLLDAAIINPSHILNHCIQRRASKPRAAFAAQYVASEGHTMHIRRVQKLSADPGRKKK
jgi:hypothetical protein